MPTSAQKRPNDTAGRYGDSPRGEMSPQVTKGGRTIDPYKRKPHPYFVGVALCGLPRATT